jgi:predicted regulator of Ras-like GTPase activity (Roadblock/LC7/MglB family)
MVTRESELLSVLGKLKDDLGDPQWVALVDDRGLVMACVPENPQIDIERVAAMVAALTISGERVINEIAGGHLRYVNVSGSKRQQLIIFLNLECVLTLGLDPYVSPRYTCKALARWAPKIMQILQMSFSGD